MPGAGPKSQYEVCSTKSELLRLWAEAARLYSTALLNLEHDGLPLSDGVHLAHRQCGAFHKAFDDHRKEHGC
jgi:hypothetical protein